jgi:hypothetical protein
MAASKRLASRQPLQWWQAKVCPDNNAVTGTIFVLATVATVSQVPFLVLATVATVNFCLSLGLGWDKMQPYP